ncbi:3-oxoacyl-ACP synthase III [Egicoccus sp. AB-alg6-2]|uniref:3-oxoacyl-ACP synthase III n=1 Tax=Egicoccus sp. AB-alg6-2 TaxID=3242692 RepID=UPI00359E5CB1
MNPHGNATLRHEHTSVLSVEVADAPEIATSAMFDERLAETYERLGVRPGLLENLAGIVERRWWPEGTLFSTVAATAGEAAIEAAGIDRERIGLLIDTSVSRDHLEPSAAVAVHHDLGLGSHCLNFDLANACLGFINGMNLAAMMIDAGQIEYALIVDGEGSRYTQERTLQRLEGPDVTVEQLFAEFASLTLGSGGAAMVLGRSDAHPEGHRLLGGEARAGSEHRLLCVGDLDGMTTDTAALLEAGLDVAEQTWTAAERNGWDWGALDHYIMHQVSAVHTTAMQKRLGIDPDKAPLSFPTRGNIGPASIPTTLALHQDEIRGGDRVLLTGIGSGINTTALELLW